MAVALVLTSTVLLLAATLAQLCVNIEQEQRFNCLPDMQPDDVNEETCQQRDCCFSRAPENAIYSDQVPSCFYPVDYATYMVDNFTETSYGYSATLQFSGESGARFPLPNVVETLSLQLYFYPVSKFIRVKIFDPANPRYQVPDAYPASNREEAVFSSLFPTEVNMNGKSVVVRDELDLLLLDFSVAPLIFTDQFIQISLSTGSEYAYGFEQGNDVFAKPMNTWRKYIFSSHWNYYEPNGHPFGMFMRKEKSSFGMFLLNSNAMEIELTPCPALTYRTKGGIIDLFIYAGATPDAVVKQHLQVVGMPLMPPYWALGLHLNGFAATGENEEAAGLWSFVESQKKDEIPHDSLILDVDACTEQNKWTKGLGLETLQSHISKLHKRNVRLVLTDNPVVSEELVTGEEELFVKDGTSTAVGNSSVCDSSFAVLDYTNENATASWWATALASSKRNSTAIDGLRLDNDDLTELGMDFSCGTSVYDARFIPGKIEESEKLYLTAGHAAGPNYNLHTLRGHFHAKVANKVLQMLHPTKRPFILTRSLFAGTGKYAHLWINDVPFDWKAITDLVNPLLNLNLFGMPLVGTELCKSSSVEDELCQRWNQLVVFYPFMTYKHQIDEASKTAHPCGGAG